MQYFIKSLSSNRVKRSIKQLLRSALESPRYWLNRGIFSADGFCHIVFVCQGNVCRSAFAEFYLRSLVSSSSVRIESCGLDVHCNGPCPDKAVEVSRNYGIDLNSHLSKSYTECDLAGADLIVPMEYPQYLQLVALFPEYKNKIHLVKDFTAWPDRLACNVYDPFGLNGLAFKICFEKIIAALDRLPLK